MADDKVQALSGPDFKTGVTVDALAQNEPPLGHYDGEPVILVRQGNQIFATGAVCSHYSGPLDQGLVVDQTIRCPWHHARFDLRTGEAIGAPALNPVSCFTVEREGDLAKITGKQTPDSGSACPLNPSSVVIVGAGAAGAGCADMLRAKGYAGAVTLAGDEEPGPVDRPNLSKDFLAGTATEDWIPLGRATITIRSRWILVTGDPAVRISTADRQVSLRSGRVLTYGALLLATGAEPRSLAIEGADLPHVYRSGRSPTARRLSSKQRQPALRGHRLRFYRSGSGRFASPSWRCCISHRSGARSTGEGFGSGAGPIHPGPP